MNKIIIIHKIGSLAKHAHIKVQCNGCKRKIQDGEQCESYRSHWDGYSVHQRYYCIDCLSKPVLVYQPLKIIPFHYKKIERNRLNYSSISLYALHNISVLTGRHCVELLLTSMKPDVTYPLQELALMASLSTMKVACYLKPYVHSGLVERVIKHNFPKHGCKQRNYRKSPNLYDSIKVMELCIFSQ